MEQADTVERQALHEGAETVLLPWPAPRAGGSLVSVALVRHVGVHVPESQGLHQGRRKILRTRTKQDQAKPGDKAEL